MGMWYRGGKDQLSNENITHFSIYMSIRHKEFTMLMSGMEYSGITVDRDDVIKWKPFSCYCPFVQQASNAGFHVFFDVSLKKSLIK